jgi:hypothetical protein
MTFNCSVGISIWFEKKNEKVCKSYNHVTSSRFNLTNNDIYLIKLSLSDEKFTYAKLISFDLFAILNGYLCTLSWSSHLTIV